MISIVFLLGMIFLIWSLHFVKPWELGWQLASTIYAMDFVAFAVLLAGFITMVRA